MDLTLKQLRYFVAVAEELSFTRAAARLHLSQPALSVQIARLERDVGAQLLIRTSRSVELTDAGRGFHEDARRVIADLERARERARRTQETAGAALRIAHTASVAYQALPLILDELATTAPEIVVSARQEWSTRALEEVMLGEADVALVREFAGEEGLRAEVVRREPLAAFMSVRHPLAGRGAIGIGDLRGHPVVVVPEALAPGFHSLVGRLCEGRGFRPAEVEMTSPENREPLLAHLSRHPEHLFVGPVSMAGLAWEGVVHVPLDDADARIGLSLVWADARPTPVVGRALAAARAVAAREGWDAPGP
jgi:DNA-binding transcriptional LysR family regulator